MTTFYVDAAPYNAVGDGLTNDRGAIQAALNAAAVTGGKVLLGPKGYRVAGGILNVPQNVTLEGPIHPGGQRDLADYRSIPGTIWLDPAAGHIRVRRNAALRNLAVIHVARQAGPPAANDWRAAVGIRASMTGTAIIVGTGAFNSGSDVLLEGLLVLGFNLAIRSDYNQRTTFRDIRGDNHNGIHLSRAYDVPRMENVHFWPFLTANLTGVPRYNLPTIMSIAGLIGDPATIHTVGPHGLVTGDVVNTWGIGGCGELNGRWAVSVVSATAFTLLGSAVQNAWTGGGGAAIYNNRRNGTAFLIEDCDWPNLSACFSYGYHRGFHLAGYANGTSMGTFTSCYVDDDISLEDPSTLGVYVSGGSFRNKFIGGGISSQGVAVASETDPAHQNSNLGDTQFIGTMIGGSAVGPPDVWVDRSAVTLIGCDLPGVRLHLQSTGGGLAAIGCDARTATFHGDTSRIRVAANRT